jgi:hypothetical protein
MTQIPGALMDRTLIDRFDADADVPARAIEGLTREDLHASPPSNAGKWSIQQLIVHLMDSHVTAAWRMRRIIAEDNPLITAYDESAFVQRLGYEHTDTKAAAEIFRLTQRLTANLLRRLPDAAFARSGIHTERGKVTLGELVPDYINHLEHHMKFLRAKRTALGKPLPA